jgi:hypothetical protein
MNDAQPRLFPPWWSEEERSNPVGQIVFIRYRCRRCNLWSNPIDSRQEPPGGCRKCVELPLAERKP